MASDLAVIQKLKSFNREKSIRRAESREKMLAKIERVEKPVEYEKSLSLSLTPSVISGNDVLTVTDFAKSFGENHLFDHLSFSIKRGEKVAIIGTSGCGKSTLLKVLSGIKPIYSGELLYQGQKLVRNERSIALMLQNDGLLLWKSITENTALPLCFQKLPKKQARERAEYLLNELGLKDAAKKYPAQLSGVNAKELFITCNADDPAAYLMVSSTEGKGTSYLVFAPDERVRSAIVKFVPKFISNSAFK